VNSEDIKKVSDLRMLFIEKQGLQDEFSDWLEKQPQEEANLEITDKDSSRPYADSYVDGSEIRVNITDTNCSVLLSFTSKKDFEDFCVEVKNLEGRDK